MAANKRVVVEFLGKDKSLGTTADQAGTRVGRLGKRMATVGKVAALGFAGGALVAGKAMFDMTKGAIEDDAAQKRLARTLKNTTGATAAQVKGVESWISKQGRALGVTDDELRPALGKLVAATGDVGEAQRQMGIAMDASAGTGKSLESVTAAMAKANNGNTTALAKLGIKTKDADGKALSFDQTMKNMSKTFGGQAATKANTLEGKMGRLRLIMDETKESIGAKLIPVVTKLADWFLTKAGPAIGSFVQDVRAKLGPVIAWVRGLFQSNTNGMASDVSKNLGAIKDTFSSVVSIIQSLWARFGPTILQYIKTTLSTARAIIGGALQVIAGIFKVFSSLLKGDWKGVWDGIKQILRGAWAVIKGLVRQGFAIVRALFRSAGVTIKAIFVGIWHGIQGAAGAGISKLVGIVRGVPGKLRALAGKFSSAGKHLISRFVDGLSNAGQFISNIAGNITKAVKGAINAAIDKINSHLKIHIDWPGPGSFNWQASIPHLAQGGVVRARTGGTLALLGEAGADEAVVPLSGKNAPPWLGRSGAGSMGGGDPLVVQLMVDGKVLAQSLVKYERDTGRPVLSRV